jgi:hypothetical protein
MKPALALLATLVAAGALAGCSSPAKPDPAADADFSGLDLQASATTGLIRGIVVDDAIRPIAGADVTLSPGDQTARTTAGGTFGFDGLAGGTYFLKVTKDGYNETQASTDVAAGVAEPPIVKVLLARNPATAPYVETQTFNGFLSFGASIGITSVGTTINGAISETLDDHSIWNVAVTALPSWAQGELVWEQNQPAGGMLIWEMVEGGTNNWRGHRETTTSPALAYWNTTVLAENASSVLADGIDYRFFGGPHPLLAPGGGVVPPADQCPTVDTGPVLGPRNPCRFGYGTTVQQRADAYVHLLYNFVPPEGWRFTKDGAPVLPP